MTSKDHVPDRRTALLAFAAGGAAFLSGCRASADTPRAPPRPAPSPPSAASSTAVPPFVKPAGPHAVVPLPFDPSKLRGLSERLVVSHHENNYAGAVKNLNKVEAELASLSKDAPAFVVGGLRERALAFRGSATLHELYFGNLGGDGVVPTEVERWLAEGFGSRGHWEETFRATAGALAGGSGWVVLAYDLHRQSIVVDWSSNHTQSGVMTAPLLVLDMYEHAYQMDYGAAAARYVDAFFANVRWDVVASRFTRARKAGALLHEA